MQAVPTPPQHQTSPSPQQRKPNDSPPMTTPPVSPPIVLFILFGIIFYVLGCLNEYKLCENDIFCDLNNGFKFKNVNENIENVKWEFDFYDYGYCQYQHHLLYLLLQ